MTLVLFRRVFDRNIIFYIFRQLMDLMIKGVIDFIFKKGAWELCGSCANPRSDINGRYWQIQSTGIVPPSAACTSATNCGQGQAMPTPPYTHWGAPINAASNILRKYGEYNITPTLTRGQALETWYRTGSGIVTIPMWMPYYELIPELAPPSRQLPGRTRPSIRPTPYKYIPNRRPDEFEPPPPPLERPPERDPERPEQSTEVEVGTKPPVVRYRPYVSSRRPPDRNTKEKKFGGSSETVQSIFRNVSRALNGATELMDFLEEWVDALPEKVRKRHFPKGTRKTPQNMLQAIYENMDLTDWNKFMDNLVNNYIEDKVVGKGIDLSDKASHQRGDQATTKGRGTWLPRW